MSIQIILDTYKRYLQTLNDRDCDLFQNYTKIKDFIDNNSSNELNSVLSRHCIGQNLKVIRKRDIKIKSCCTEGWSTLAVSEGYKLLERIQRASRFGMQESYILNLRNFFKLVDCQNPHVQLYLYLCYADRVDANLFEVSMEEIEEAAAKAVKAEEEAANPCETENETNSETKV